VEQSAERERKIVEASLLYSLSRIRLLYSISPNQNINKIIQFIHQNLLIYTEAGSALLRENFHRLPMILSGDFNVDFSKDTSKPLVNFLISILNLNMSNDPNESTTKYGTTIDGVF